MTDEPTAELDSVAADVVLARIADLAARGVTFILATHDRSVMAIADHRLTLDHGVVAESSPTGERRCRPRSGRRCDGRRR